MLGITFEAAFSSLFVYNILFEDAEVDGKYLALDENSRVLGISAAGCGLASMLRFHPAHIDAVDINRHHLALSALKMQATRDLKSHSELYDLFGHGRVDSPRRAVSSLCDELPAWIAKYWEKHHTRFERSLYQQGLTAWMLGELRKQIGLGTAWMHDFSKYPAERRQAMIVELTEPVMQKPLVRGMLRSPLNQLALGVNYQQMVRMLGDEGQDIVDFILGHLKRVAATDIETNWFAWYAAAGHFNHENPKAVPPYLRQESHTASREAPTTFGFHAKGIVEVMESAPRETWTHYSLCDAIDWMSRDIQTLLLDEIVRTAKPGAVVLMRSVQPSDVVRECRMDHRLVRCDDESEKATREERSCQYQRVDFYRVEK